jgi:hypothetical protein
MTYKEFEKAFKAIEQFHLENELANEAVKTFCASSHAVCDIGCHLYDQYINLLASVVGDKGNWISWYVFENDFGRGGLTAGMKDDKKMVKVDTLKKLYNFIKR